MTDLFPSKDLLPCPFCGCAGELRDEGPPWFVTCVECEADCAWSDTPEQAVQNWNKRATPEPCTARRKFDDLPKGTRFRYVGYTDVYVKLEGHDCGLVARWDGPNADAITQQVFSFADTAREARTKEVDVVECTTPPPSAVPPLDDEVRWILGRPNFACASIAEGLRLGGHAIERKSEHEQAAVIHWMLGMYVKHGNDWRGIAENELHTMRNATTKSAAT